jgi:putative transposase
VARVLDQISQSRGLPERVVTDNGPEFTSRALDHWAYERGVK